jgi:hypothetical protein
MANPLPTLPPSDLAAFLLGKLAPVRDAMFEVMRDLMLAKAKLDAIAPILQDGNENLARVGFPTQHPEIWVLDRPHLEAAIMQAADLLTRAETAIGVVELADSKGTA